MFSNEQELGQSEMDCLLAQWEELDSPMASIKEATTSSGIFSTRTGKKVEALIGVICLFGIDLKLPDIQMVK